MQFRESDRAATHTPTVVQESLPAGAYLSVRLWTPSTAGERVTLPWDSSDPAVALAVDLLTASQGVRADTAAVRSPETEGLGSRSNAWFSSRSEGLTHRPRFTRLGSMLLNIRQVVLLVVVVVGDAVGACRR